MTKDFDFGMSLSFGEMGVNLVKSILRSKYKNIIDYNNDQAMQKRGIDIWVETLGFVEIKCDSHSSERFFFELSVAGKPGAVDRCSADYYAMLYYKERRLFLIKRPELQMWLRNHWHWVKHEHPDWVKTIYSSSKGQKWAATGITVPKDIIDKDINIAVLTWGEADEVIEMKGE